MLRLIRIPAAVLVMVLGVCAAGAQSDFSAADRILNNAVDDHQIPGAVLVVGHEGRVVYRRAYGWRSLEPARESMTLDTVFDMASLTKALMTATAVMQLYEQGKISPNEPVSKYLPEFAANG